MAGKKTIEVICYDEVRLDSKPKVPYCSLWIRLHVGRRRHYCAIDFIGMEKIQREIESHYRYIEDFNPASPGFEKLNEQRTASVNQMLKRDSQTNEVTPLCDPPITDVLGVYREHYPEFRAKSLPFIEKWQAALNTLKNGEPFCLIDNDEPNPDLPYIGVGKSELTRDDVHLGLAWFLRQRLGITAPLRLSWHKTGLTVIPDMT